MYRLGEMVVEWDLFLAGSMLRLLLQRPTVASRRRLTTSRVYCDSVSLKEGCVVGEGIQGFTESDSCSNEVSFRRQLFVESPQFRNLIRILRERAWGPITELALQEFAEGLTPRLVAEVIRHQEVDSAFRFFEWAKKQEGYCHDVHSYNAMVKKLAASQNFTVAGEILKEMKRVGSEVNSYTFVPFIVHYGKAGMVRRALGTLNCMNTFNFRSDKRIGFHLTQVLESNSDKVPGVEDILAHIDFSNREAFETLIICLGRAGKVDHAEKLLEEMEIRGFTPNVNNYAILVDCNCRAGRVGRAFELINLTQQKGLQPDASVFNPLIYLQCQSGSIEGALKLFEDMGKRGCNANSVTYNILISGYFRRGQIDEAIATLSRMLVEGPVPTEFTWGVIFRGLFLSGHLGKIVEIVDDSIRRGITLYRESLNYVLQRLCKNGKFEEAEKLFNKMLGGVCIPNSHSYSIMMKGCFSAGKVEKAKELYKNMKDRGCNPTPVVYLCLITGLCDVCEFKEAAQMVEEMIELCSDLELDHSTNSTILRKLSQSGMLNESLKFSWHIANNRLTVRKIELQSLMILLCEKGLNNEATNLNSELWKRGCVVHAL
eukprot:c20724_g1_i1 orf=122-1921(-)